MSARKVDVDTKSDTNGMYGDLNVQLPFTQQATNDELRRDDEKHLRLINVDAVVRPSVVGSRYGKVVPRYVPFAGTSVARARMDDDGRPRSNGSGNNPVDSV